MKKLFVFVYLLSSSFSAHAQLQDMSVGLDHRFDGITNEETGKAETERLQERIRIGFTYNAHGYFKVVTLLNTGPNYANDWYELANAQKKPSNNPNIAFHRLYVEKIFGHNTAQFGQINGIDQIGSSGITSTGWIDGLSFSHTFQGGEQIHGVFGSIKDANNTNIFDRTRALNYAEIVVSKTFFKKLVTDSGYEYFDGDNLLKEKLSLDVHVFGKKIFTLLANVLYSSKTNTANFDIGVTEDVLDTWLGKFKDYLKLSVYYSHLSGGLHDRNSLYALYYQDGSIIATQLSGKIDNKGRFGWMIRDAYGIKGTNGSAQMKNRFDVGATILLKKP